MQVCMLEDSIYKSVANMSEDRSSLAKVLHLERFRNDNPPIENSAADLYLRSKTKSLYGKSVPYYCFCFDVNKENDSKGQCIEIPATRLLNSLQRMVHTYESDKAGEDESFAHWGARRGTPFFTELLEDVTLVGPDDLHEFLDHPDEDMELVR